MSSKIPTMPRTIVITYNGLPKIITIPDEDRPRRRDLIMPAWAGEEIESSNLTGPWAV